MSLHRFEIEVEIDDARLAQKPHIPRDPSTWFGSDLFRAGNELVVDTEATKITSYDCLEEPAKKAKRRKQ